VVLLVFVVPVGPVGPGGPPGPKLTRKDPQLLLSITPSPSLSKKFSKLVIAKAVIFR
jgi:hypothetical protein